MTLPTPRVLLLLPSKDANQSLVKGFSNYYGTDRVNVVTMDQFNIVATSGRVRVKLSRNQLEDYDIIHLGGPTTGTLGYYLPQLVSCLVNDNQITINTGYSAVWNSKIVQFVMMAKKGLPLPKSVVSLGGIEEAVAIFEAELEYPFVLKPDIGSRGTSVYLIGSRAELKTAWAENKYSLMFAQEYIVNDSDYRVVLLRNKINKIVLRKRDPNKEWRNNISLGASMEELDKDKVDSEIIELSLEANRSLRNQELVGVDVVQDSRTGIYYLLEVNYRPGTNEKTSYDIAAELMKIYQEKHKHA